MNIAITIIEPTESNAATAAKAVISINPKLIADVGIPKDLANPLSKVAILSHRQNMNIRIDIERQTKAMRGNSSGSAKIATGSNSDCQPSALSHTSDSKLPISACSTSR